MIALKASSASSSAPGIDKLFLSSSGPDHKCPYPAAGRTRSCSRFLPASPSWPPGPASAAQAHGLDVRIPLQDKSVRFAVIGDSGTGERAQYEVAQQMRLTGNRRSSTS